MAASFVGQILEESLVQISLVLYYCSIILDTTLVEILPCALEKQFRLILQADHNERINCNY